MSAPRHILGSFEDAMQLLSCDLQTMADRAKRNLADAVQGLLEGNEGLCNRTIAGDDEVDRLEVRMDASGHDIILRYSPVSADLRQVISTIRVSMALERISDHAVGIARRGRDLSRRPVMPEAQWLRPAYEHAAFRLKRSLDAYFRGDLSQAMEVAQRDRMRKDGHQELADRLTQRLQEDSRRARDMIALLFVVRMLERVSDHAENIAEDAVFLLTAHDVRHGGCEPAIPARPEGPPR